MKNLSKNQIATATALFFHAIGLGGLLLLNAPLITRSTPLILLVSSILLIWTQPNKNFAFFLFTALIIIIGYLSEVAGVNTHLLFGDYVYGNVLGPQWLNVPLVIGINWFIIIYCSGISTHTLLLKLITRVATDSKEPAVLLKAMSVIVDGATLAVMFDWLMEPVAVKLGFWTWGGDGSIPLYNYICWMVVSMLLLTIFQFCRFDKENKFAVNLLLIQAMFFLLLRTFLH
ncbi:MAG: carotenoid biosynthesis protein [Ferruginibacter sp.]